MNLVFLSLICICDIIFILMAGASSSEEESYFLNLMTSHTPESSEKIVELLTENSDLANLKTPQGESALHLACIYGHAMNIKVLLQKGADPNYRSNVVPESLDMTPLTWCAYAGYTAAIQEFLNDERTNVNLVVGKEDGSFMTALDIALKIGEVGKDEVILLRSHSALTFEQLVEERSDWKQFLPPAKTEILEEL